MREETYDEDDFENCFVGGVKGPIHFNHFSLFAKIDSKSLAALEKYGDKTMGTIDMELNRTYLSITTFIHELAHVAVLRWQAWQVGKKYRIEDETMHGPIFQKAYERLIIRAEKLLGEPLEHNRADLEMYREKEK